MLQQLKWVSPPDSSLFSTVEGASSDNDMMLPGNVLLLNMSPTPRSSYHCNNSALHLERTCSDQSTFCWEPEKSPDFSSFASLSSNVTPTMKSSAELMKEIASIEDEIIRLERYLLSLYRTAFEQCLPNSIDNKGTYLQYNTGSSLQVKADQSCYKIDSDMWKVCMASHHQTSTPCELVGSDNLGTAAAQKATSEQKGVDPGRCSLADLLVFSCIDKALDAPDRLSEEIVKCISSIYCKLANPTSTHTGFSICSTSSLSSSTSSTFSPRNLSDSWSPHLNGETTGHEHIQGFKEESRPYAAMIEVLKICLDDDNFNYAARMLQKFRSLVKSLEKVDPRKMKREEKLAFWINIHNALVMHAYLAYGTHTDVRSTSILKATYNVGGHCINSCIIQSSILGIRSHYSLPWLQMLLSPGKKFQMGSAAGHVYAIEYPEPLVHFALCSGAYSDPAVRVYTAKNVFQDLKLAKDEFIQATVYIQKETKIFLPKVLNFFAKDMSLDVLQLLKLVNDCLSEVQPMAIVKCLKGRPDKCIHWLPQSSNFRYLIHGELAKGMISD